MPEVQTQGEITNAKFIQGISNLSQAVTNQFWKKRGYRQEVVHSQKIRQQLIMNPPSFTGSITSEDLENFIQELKKVLFDACC